MKHALLMWPVGAALACTSVSESTQTRIYERALAELNAAYVVAPPYSVDGQLLRMWFPEEQVVPHRPTPGWSESSYRIGSNASLETAARRAGVVRCALVRGECPREPGAVVVSLTEALREGAYYEVGAVITEFVRQGWGQRGLIIRLDRRTLQLVTLERSWSAHGGG